MLLGIRQVTLVSENRNIFCNDVSGLDNAQGAALAESK